MPVKKSRFQKEGERREARSLTPDDIVQAIDAVQQAGLTVHGVEITIHGSINIRTTSPFKRSVASKSQATADSTDALEPAKKRA
jgi:hypothetical protein